MISELIVTSAPRGLLAGRTGFTTVCRTRGIHPDLASRLEAASGYRHVFPQGDPRNPVVLSYTCKPSSLGDVWVMSRVGDAGTDYTGRSNKIAHHIALQQSDFAPLAKSNPAAVMAALVAAGGLLANWQGEPRENIAPPTLASPPTNPAPCHKWAAMTGDPGWAGVLVERALNKDATWIIAPPGTDLLALFSEALALMSENQRWMVPFTTYSLRGDEGRWLGTVAGSPEAEAAAAQKRIPVIDLTIRSAAHSGGPYVSAARGRASVPWHRDKPVRHKAAVAIPESATAGHTSSPPDVDRVHPGLPPVLKPPPNSTHRRPPGLTEWEDVDLAKPRTGRLSLFLTLGVVVLLLGSLIGGYSAYRLNWLTESPTTPAAERPTTNRPSDSPRYQHSTIAQDDQTITAQNPRAIIDDNPQPSSTGQGSLRGDTAISSGPDIQQTKHSAQPPGTTPSGNSTTEEKQPPVLELLIKAIRDQNHLPKEGLALSGHQEKASRVLLAQWGTRAAPGSLSDISLTMPEVSESPNQCTLSPIKETKDDSQRQWKCEIQGNSPKHAGTFTLTCTTLEFQRGPDTAPEESPLPFLPLLVSSNNPQKEILAWMQLIHPVAREMLHAGKDPKPSSIWGNKLIPDAVSGSGENQRLILRYVNVQAKSSGVVLQLSEAGEFAFKDKIAVKDVTFTNTPTETRLWWRPFSIEGDADAELAFQETVTLIAEVETNDGGALKASADFKYETALITANKKDRIGNLLRLNFESDKLEKNSFRNINEELLFGVLPGADIKDKKEDLKKDLADIKKPDNEAWSLRHWIAGLKETQCESIDKFFTHISQLAEEQITTRDKPQKNADETAEAYEKRANELRVERKKKITDKLKADPRELVKWGEPLKACQQNDRPDDFHYYLLWEALYKEVVAHDKHFTYLSPKAVEDPEDKAIADVSRDATLLISGELGLDWSGVLSDFDLSGVEKPFVHLVNFSTQADKNKTPSDDSQSKSGAGAHADKTTGLSAGNANGGESR